MIWLRGCREGVGRSDYAWGREVCRPNRARGINKGGG